MTTTIILSEDKTLDGSSSVEIVVDTLVTEAGAAQEYELHFSASSELSLIVTRDQAVELGTALAEALGGGGE